MASITSDKNPHRKDIEKLESVADVLQFIVEKDVTVVFETVMMLYKRAVCLPVTSVEVECSFSSMSYIKNYLRNSMGDERLCNLLLLYKARRYVKDLNMEVVLDRWYKKKNRRIAI